MEHPDDIKDLGNDAMKAGNYTEAVRQYTRAIEIEANAVYFANRAAAQMKLGKMAEAVADGDRAIEAKRDYPKAYAQKGTALELLNRTEDAKAAYAAGLEACSGSELLKEKLSALEARIRRAAAEASRPAGSPAAGAAASSGSGSSASRPRGPAPAVSGLRGSIVTYGRLAMLASALLYLLPLLPFSRPAYTAYMALSMAVHAALILVEAGPFALSKEFAAGALQSVWLPPFLTAAVGLMATPSLLLLLAAGAIDLVAAGETLWSLTRGRVPALASVLETVASKGLPLLLQRPGGEVQGMSRSAQWAGANAALTRLAASCEVWASLMMLLELLTPGRSLLATLMMWQTQQLKYSVSEATREAWGATHRTVSRWLGHRLVPAVVLRAFESLAALLRRQVRSPQDLQRDMEAQAAGAGGAAAGGAGGIAGGLMGAAKQACVVQ